MKKFLMLLMAMAVAATLSFAQTGAGSSGDQAQHHKGAHTASKSDEHHEHKGGKKGHKGGKKSKKGSGSSTTPPPK